MAFNPKNFVKTANQTWADKLNFDKFIKENEHLAAPFHIEGLESVLPKQYPGELAVHFAKSHHGKSTALRNAAFKAQRRVEDTDFMIGVVSLEDTAEANAAKVALRYSNPLDFQDDQMVFVGRSFSMEVATMTELNVDNIISSLEHALKSFPGKKGFSHIFVDYAQAIPDLSGRERREQLIYIVNKLFDAATQFKCPIDFASQALLKQQRDFYTSHMKIPGAADLKEAGELYEVPNIAIAYWMPKLEPNSPIGTLIDDGGWCFRVEPNLIFVRIAKWRNCELQGFDVVGRVFPCWIQKDGSVVYDPDKHKHMHLKSIEEKLANSNPNLR